MENEEMVFIVNPNFEQEFLDLVKGKQIFQNISVIYSTNIQGCVLLPKTHIKMMIVTEKESKV